MAVHASITEIDRGGLKALLAAKVAEVAGHPEHSGAGASFMGDQQGRPVVGLAVTNCRPDLDIWQGLRSPAQVGLHAINLEDIWMHYAAANIQSTRADGSPNPLAMPEPFADALARYKRAIIISGMLALNPQVLAVHAERIARGEVSPADDYCRARSEVGAIINKAVGRLALALMGPGRAVVPMTQKNADKVIDGTRSAYTKGRYHGPCNSHWPQGSIAVMSGLLRFGVNRLPFRDELGEDGEVRRLFGQYAGIVIFDEAPLATDASGGVTLLDEDRLAWLRRINNYTDVAEDVLAQRYCTYNLTGADGASVCGRCIEACPSGALDHSSPGPDGVYPERLLAQKHRFSQGWLDFDNGNCSRERSQKAQLYPEYVCARCEAVCAVAGVRPSPADVARMNG